MLVGAVVVVEALVAVAVVLRLLVAAAAAVQLLLAAALCDSCRGIRPVIYTRRLAFFLKFTY